MFPLSDSTGHATASMCKPYLVALCALPCAASAAGLASWMLPVGAAVPSALWWSMLRRFEDQPNIANCRRFFLGSLSYLLATLALFTAYARVESEQAVDQSAPVTGPAWRAAVHERVVSWGLCPH